MVLEALLPWRKNVDDGLELLAYAEDSEQVKS